MRRIQMYLDGKTTEALTQFAETKNISISNAAADILKNYFQGNITQSPNAPNSETKAYFLRIINTLNQVLMCVYDPDKTSLQAESAEECIQTIKQQIQAFVEKENTLLDARS